MSEKLAEEIESELLDADDGIEGHKMEVDILVYKRVGEDGLLRLRRMAVASLILSPARCSPQKSESGTALAMWLSSCDSKEQK